MTETLAKTPLFELHQSLGAKMVPFAGYSMPVQYPLGVLKEHQHTRTAAGLFDVSHMGQLRLSGEGCREALEKLLPIDVIDLPLNGQRYALLTTEAGGIQDDLMVTNCGDHLLLVVNAACKVEDTAYLRANLPGLLLEELSDRALLALQGPEARQILSRLAPAAARLCFMQAAAITIAGIDCFVSCSGYTGEDGYEISVANDSAQQLATRLLAEPEVEAIGLGARDSLRLEAGLCLYGHDLDTQTSPIEASLLWSISKVRRPGEARAGGYPGAERVAREIAEGVGRKRIMLKPAGRAPVREGAQLVDEGGKVVGQVTSGGFGPSIAGPVAMAYVDSDYLSQGGSLFASVRGKQLAVDRVLGGLLPSRYFRG